MFGKSLKAKRTFNLLSLAAVIALVVTALGSRPVFATTPNVITVTTVADNLAIDGYCSLREAITNANSGGQVHANAGECGAGGGSVEIDFSPSLTGKTITLKSALPTLTTSMDFYSPVKITISGAGYYRPFWIGSGVTVKMTNLILTKGNAKTSSGGAIFNYGNLTVLNSTLSGNKALNGGAIFSSTYGTTPASVNIVNSTLSGNVVGNDGGAIYVTAVSGISSTLSISNSTITANKAGRGGGIGQYSSSASLVLLNDTISGNSASYSYGGGLYEYGGGTINIANTVIANSPSGGDCYAQAPSIGINSNNLVEDGSCFSSGTNFLSGDPALGPLADNGNNPGFGFNQTISPASNSPLIAAGLGTICTAAPMNNFDQRGYTRHANCTIGAVEYFPTQYVQNGGLESYVATANPQVPDDWKAVNFSLTDGKDITTYQAGAASVKIVGVPSKTKTLSQTILVSRPAGDYFTFSFWMAGSAIPTTGTCKAQVTFFSGTTLKASRSVPCPTGTTGFTLHSMTFTTTWTFTKAVVSLVYAKPSGTVWFDNVSLTR